MAKIKTWVCAGTHVRVRVFCPLGDLLHRLLLRYGRKSTASCFAVLSLVNALLALPSAGGAELPLLPGVGAVDRRVAVDPRQSPWDAIAKVQTNIGTRCTGALIAPGTVLTAAHCLYNRRTRALLQAGSLR